MPLYAISRKLLIFSIRFIGQKKCLFDYITDIRYEPALSGPAMTLFDEPYVYTIRGRPVFYHFREIWPKVSAIPQ